MSTTVLTVEATASVFIQPTVISNLTRSVFQIPFRNLKPFSLLAYMPFETHLLMFISTGGLRMFDGQGQRKEKGHLMYLGGTSAPKVVVHFTKFHPLGGHPRRRFIMFYLPYEHPRAYQTRCQAI